MGNGVKQKRATIRAVAKHAGVSRSTVSRVLTGSPSVSDAARKSVQQAIDDLGYVPSRAAQSLATKRAGVAVLVIPEDIDHFFAEPFFTPVITGIDAELSEAGYILTMFIASSEAREKGEQYLLSGAADGALVLSHRLPDESVRQLMGSIPVVFGGLSPCPDSHPYYVDADNREGGYLAARHLIDAGHTKIAMITGDLEMPASEHRLEGFNRALKEENLVAEGIEAGESTRRGGYQAMGELLDTARPTAVFVGGDLMARGAISCATDRGLRVPEDVAVVGFDDAAAATSEWPQLTTIRQPLNEYGREMARMLLNLLSGEEPDAPVVLPVELVVRETA